MSSIAISSQDKGIQLPAHGRGAAFLFGSIHLRVEFSFPFGLKVIFIFEHKN